MSNILAKILNNTKKELEQRKELVSIKELEKKQYYQQKRISLTQSIKKTANAIIAEIKFRSPAKGQLRTTIDPANLGLGYQKAGAAAISVLTDEKYFAGKLEYLSEVRNVTNIPILRKEFIIDKYQIIESRAIGADTILLIAAALPPEQIKALAKFARSLELEVLLEIHQENLADFLSDDINLVGINNRNLKSLEISVQNSLDLIKQIPNQFVKISESGLNDFAIIKKLQQAGFDGFLMGEAFMKTVSPKKSLATLLANLS